MKMALFWVVAPCSMVEVYRCFNGACCLRHQGEAAARTSETSVKLYKTTRRNNPEDSDLQIDYFCVYIYIYMKCLNRVWGQKIHSDLKSNTLRMYIYIISRSSCNINV
jgi:hypothetical protein